METGWPAAPNVDVVSFSFFLLRCRAGEEFGELRGECDARSPNAERASIMRAVAPSVSHLATLPAMAGVATGWHVTTDRGGVSDRGLAALRARRIASRTIMCWVHVLQEGGGFVQVTE